MSALTDFFRRLFGWPKHIDPLIFGCLDNGDACQNAHNFAKDDPLFRVWAFAPTGSMAPIIPKAKGYLVTKSIPFNEIRLGIIATYNASWNPGSPVTHRLVAKDRLGYIASGDANARSESFDRVTRGNFIGEVVAVFTYPQPVDNT